MFGPVGRFLGKALADGRDISKNKEIEGTYCPAQSARLSTFPFLSFLGPHATRINSARAGPRKIKEKEKT